MVARLSQTACIAILLTAALHAGAQDSALFSQSASASLDRQFGGQPISWILLDRSGQVVVQHWNDAERPIAPGSLLKPLLALAYGKQRGGKFNRAFCAGTRGRCWYPPGHGMIGLEEALAQSCNAYFLSLAHDLDRVRAMQTFEQLGLVGPPANASDETLIGLDGRWTESPLTLARAYLRLQQDAPPDLRNRILSGMRESAMQGTARSVDAAIGSGAALAKTGTAPCSHHPRGAADGFTVVLYPADQPRFLLLVRMHGVTGAETSRAAGAMLRAIGAGAP